ncbi:MAG: hypothetical protein HY862_12185 [Chloroflexi bacterium]|nr:hypothetical protein [Chloroflexota bacterium]
MLDKLTSADFMPYLNQEFQVHYKEGASLLVVLDKVTELNANRSLPGHRRAFSILFRAAPDATVILHQHIFKIEHPQVGTYDIFIVPVGMDENGRYYEAIFN